MFEKWRILYSHRARNQGGAGVGEAPPRKMCWAWFKTIGHSSKNLRPSLKTPRPSWSPKLVTSLILIHYKLGKENGRVLH